MPVSNHHSDPLPARIGGKYRPVRLLGRGGMGAVYEVVHEHTGHHLALKVISSTAGLTDGALERFHMEAKAAGRIRSDHVVRITDADVAPELDRAPFLVMELLEGSDLDEATRSGPAKPAEVVDWLRQVARGLSKAHELGVIHRDLKPENLFLTQRDDGSPLVKILDFGVAKLAEEAGQTRSGQLVGTPLYMAPEQAGSRDGPITTRTDGFALGLIAFKLLVGHSYWRPGSIVQLVAQATLEPMGAASERGSTFGPRFDAWFAKACARDAALRFEGPREQIEALAIAFGIDPIAISSASRPAPAFGPKTPNIETAETLAATGNLVVSRAGSLAIRRRTATAAVIGSVTVGIAAIALAVMASRSSTVVTRVDGASIVATVSASAVRVEPTTAPPSAPPTIAPLFSASAPTLNALDGGARAPSAPLRAPKPARPRRDPLEDQN